MPPTTDPSDPWLAVSETPCSPDGPDALFSTKEGKGCKQNTIHCVNTKTTVQNPSNITATDAVKTVLTRLQAPIPSTADPAKSKFAQILDVVVPDITVRELLTMYLIALAYISNPDIHTFVIKKSSVLAALTVRGTCGVIPSPAGGGTTGTCNGFSFH